jgi:hypothetical protein
VTAAAQQHMYETLRLFTDVKTVRRRRDGRSAREAARRAAGWLIERPWPLRE